MNIICRRTHISSRYNTNYVFVASYPYRLNFSYSEIVKTNKFLIHLNQVALKMQSKQKRCMQLPHWKKSFFILVFTFMCRYVNFVHNDKLNASGDILFDRIIYLLTTYLSRSFFLFYVIYSACIIPLFPTQLLRSIST